MNFLKTGLLLAILSIFFSGAVSAQSPKVVVLGKATALQTKTIGNKTVETKRIETSRPGVREAETKSRNLLNGVEAVYLDAGQFQKGTIPENEYVKEAMSKHIPIVLENVDKAALMKLSGIGVDAKVAVVESMSDKRGVRVTIIEDSPEKGLRKAQAPAVAGMQDTGEASGQMDRSKADPEKLRKAEMEQGRQRPQLPVEKAEPSPDKSRSNSLERLSTQTIEALETHKAKKAKVRLEKSTGSLAPDFENAYASIGPGFPDAGSFAEWDKPLDNPAVNSLPKYSEYHIDLNWAQREWSPWSGQTARVNVNYNIVLYATTSPKQKWMKITTSGTGVNPGSLAWNHYTDRGFYTERFYQMFGVYYPGNGKKLENARPLNANNSGSVQTTTGFTVGATAGADSNGPSTGVSASFSSSTSVTNAISDFQVVNNSDSQWAKFDYQLSKTSGGSYGNWEDLLRLCAFCEPGLYNLPGWSTGNMPAYAEGVWKFPASHNGEETLYFYQHHYMRDTWLVDGNIFHYNFRTMTRNQRYDKFVNVDFSVVQLPHLGMGGETGQSSIAHAGHHSRAVDGDVDGIWADASVTHTGLEDNPYWEIRLDEQYAHIPIEKIELWNRTDCCGQRLGNYRVFVSDQPLSSADLNGAIQEANNSNGNILMINHPGENGRKKDFVINRTARYIRVQLNGRDYLSLAEVRIVPRGYF